jgi:hypothetical protein
MDQRPKDCFLPFDSNLTLSGFILFASFRDLLGMQQGFNAALAARN